MSVIYGCKSYHQKGYIDQDQEKYMFYLHGGVVQEQGINAVSHIYGKYEYVAIVDAIQRNGFKVISEVREKETEDKDYAEKIKFQIDSLIANGIMPRNIVVVGASAGAYIALESAIMVNHSDIKYALIGLCSDYALDYFSPFKDRFIGNFLSIYESSDSKGSCALLFSIPLSQVRFKEIQLHMGINHSFLYAPHEEWVKPLVDWAKE